jgi:hypothetical protein
MTSDHDTRHAEHSFMKSEVQIMSARYPYPLAVMEPSRSRSSMKQASIQLEVYGGEWWLCTMTPSYANEDDC